MEISGGAAVVVGGASSRRCPIFETPMLNGGTIRLDGGQRFAPR
jgi:hypothetical protein